MIEIQIEKWRQMETEKRETERDKISPTETLEQSFWTLFLCLYW